MFVCACMSECVYIHVHACVCLHVCECVYICMHAWACVRVCMCECVRVHTCACVSCVCARAYLQDHLSEYMVNTTGL